MVGGDGMFSEVLNGLLDRQMKEAGHKQTIDTQPLRPDLKIGVIPAGRKNNKIFNDSEDS